MIKRGRDTTLKNRKQPFWRNLLRSIMPQIDQNNKSIQARKRHYHHFSVVMERLKVVY